MKKKYKFYWEEPKENKLNMYEMNDREIILLVELPGFRKNEIFINIKGNKVSIKAEKRKARIKKGSNYLIKESAVQSINRTFTLPEKINVKKAEARLENGILEIKMPIKKRNYV